MELFPLIFDIRHFALDDGPGIRTTVFMKGCPLSCKWCHNPEGIYKNKEIAFYSDRCVHCGNCRSVCPNQAIDPEKKYRIIRTKCDCCGLCVAECPGSALRIIGKYYSPDELADILVSDQVFYQTSSGGVTFSGGEPTLFTEYLLNVLVKLKKCSIHTAIQTSGIFDFPVFKEKLLPYVDLIYYDLKFIDKEDYKYWTGGDVERSLTNFRKLCGETDIRLIAAIPLIPGVTSTPENLKAIKEFINRSGCSEWIFRPYHPGGMVKCISLGKAVPDKIPGKGISIREEEMAKRIFHEEKPKEYSQS